MALVLCTGSYPPLLELRRILIERAGHTVFIAASDTEIVVACQRYGFDVIVIGETSLAAKLRVFDLVRMHCATAKVLELVPGQGGFLKYLPEADCWLEVPTASLDDLGQCVTDLAIGLKKKAAPESWPNPRSDKGWDVG